MDYLRNLKKRLQSLSQVEFSLALFGCKLSVVILETTFDCWTSQSFFAILHRQQNLNSPKALVRHEDSLQLDYIMYLKS